MRPTLPATSTRLVQCAAGAIVLHVAAILFYRLARGKKLTKPMITGKAALEPGVEPMRPGKWWVAMLCLAAAIAITPLDHCRRAAVRGLIATALAGPHRAMLIRTEQTPNPATRKFLPGQTVMDAARAISRRRGRRGFAARRGLFDSGMVEGVFFGRDFISVTAAPGASWRDLEPLVLEILLDHFVSGAPLFAPGSAAGIQVADDAADIEEDPADADIIDQIKELIETRVRPAVAQDGGDIVYRGYKDGTALSRDAGRLLGLPVLGDHAEARDREPDPPLCPRGRNPSKRSDRGDFACRAACDHIIAATMILAIDTSTAACTAALFDGDGACIARRRRADRPRPQRAARADDRRDARRAPSRNRILVGVGPGSFTGIRGRDRRGAGLAIGWDCESVIPIPADRQAVRGGDPDADAGEASRADPDQDAIAPAARRAVRRSSAPAARHGRGRSVRRARATQAPAPSNKAAVQAALDVSNARIMAWIVVTGGAQAASPRIQTASTDSTSGT